MFRKIASVSITGLCLLAACVSTNDDEGDDPGDGGVGGTRGGTAGASGRAGGGTAGRMGGAGGMAGVSGRAGSGGRAMGGNAGTSGSAGAGGAELMAGNGGTGATSDGGEPPTSAGEGPGGSGGSGGSAGDGGSAPDPIGGSAGDGGAPPDPIGGAGGSAGEGSDLVLHYEFEDGSGTTVADSSESNFDGTIVGGAAFTTGNEGGGLQLVSANDQYISLAPQVLANCDDLTIALWARLDAAPFNTRFLDVDGLVNGFIFFTPTAWNNNVRELRFNIYRAGQTPADYWVSAPYPVGTTLVGEWHHYAVTLSGNVGRLYFDGAEIGVNNNFVFNPSEVTIAASGAHAWIGRSLFWNAPSNPDPDLDAALDDVRISCRAYTADEIAALAE